MSPFDASTLVWGGGAGLKSILLDHVLSVSLCTYLRIAFGNFVHPPELMQSWRKEDRGSQPDHIPPRPKRTDSC